jgi:hypothetical protein
MESPILSIAHELAAVLGTDRTPGDFYAAGAIEPGCHC